MLRFGNITEVDPAKGYARVTFTDDGIVSDWLQFITLGALKDKFSHTFSINEQVACLMDSNSEEGVILGALFNNKTAPDGGGDGIFRVKFEDDSVIEYNRNSNEYNLNIKGKVNITAESEANINAVNANITATVEAKIQAPVIKLTGAVAITGAITVSGTITAPGGTPINGNLEVTGDMKAGTGLGIVSLKTHRHTSSNPGTPTSTPIP